MKTRILSIITLLLVIFLTVGCDRRKGITIPTDPTHVSSKEAVRVLAFNRVGMEYEKGDNYYIALYNTNGIYTNAEDDTVVVTIGDTTVPLTFHNYFPFEVGWVSSFGAYQLSGEEHITLKINNKVVINTFINAINPASAAFPYHYNYLQPLTLNWAVDSTNQYQFVRAESWANNVEGSNSPFSSYIKRLANNQASFTFPAKCVSLTDADSIGTQFIIGVEEVNYKIVNKNAIMVYDYEAMGYSAMGLNRVNQKHKPRIMDIYRELTR